ncbi:MAG: hypothetical protein ACI8RD_004213 [Bacillariaceae sp.]|jgi:hypothetical protein
MSKNADDDRDVESDISIITTSMESSNKINNDNDNDDDKNKIQNWFFALVLPLQLVRALYCRRRCQNVDIPC